MSGRESENSALNIQQSTKRKHCLVGLVFSRTAIGRRTVRGLRDLPKSRTAERYECCLNTRLLRSSSFHMTSVIIRMKSSFFVFSFFLVSFEKFEKEKGGARLGETHLRRLSSSKGVGRIPRRRAVGNAIWNCR